MASYRMNKRPGNRCERCGYTWSPRGHNLSATCPRCQSSRVKYNSSLGSTLFVLAVLGVAGWYFFFREGVEPLGESNTPSPVSRESEAQNTPKRPGKGQGVVAPKSLSPTPQVPDTAPLPMPADNPSGALEEGSSGQLPGGGLPKDKPDIGNAGEKPLDLTRSADRSRHCRQLAKEKGADAAPSLIEYLADTSPAVRETALYELGRLKPESALAPICAMLDRPENSQLRPTICDTLGKMGNKAAAQPLVKLLRDIDDNVVEAARRNLSLLAGGKDFGTNRHAWAHHFGVNP